MKLANQKRRHLSLRLCGIRTRYCAVHFADAQYTARSRGRGVLPYKRLLGMCRWLGSQFHDWIDCNGVAFSIELLESRGRTFSDFWGRKFLCSLGIFSSLIYYNQIAFIHIKNSIITFPFEEECFYFNSL